MLVQGIWAVRVCTRSVQGTANGNNHLIDVQAIRTFFFIESNVMEGVPSYLFIDKPTATISDTLLRGMAKDNLHPLLTSISVSLPTSSSAQTTMAGQDLVQTQKVTRPKAGGSVDLSGPIRKSRMGGFLRCHSLRPKRQAGAHSTPASCADEEVNSHLT